MYQLQVVEQAIGQSEKALVEVDLRLGSNEALESARIRAEEGRQALASVQAQQRDLDLEVQGMATHLKELEARLYGGAPATTKELMALGIAVAQRCEGCLVFHARAAQQKGASREEVAETIAVAIEMGGGPAAVYGGEAMAAFDQFATE